ncbi:polysaccharide deacetylase family protein [Paenibacillus sp. LHD-117]|uniref:polysaccharide deacetylase family protein n=1 Tax=Paenibacillus sp. LHD-117 TaxID=3071412 RepID=UPI0027E03367|nr:polysaccharide deacetylase family protein [Paenibacillus sp. LHD-117]MDQ6419073.1 polysaccharide deacetylase family protein [Paenibacillus sp. LHD-117]
MANENNWRGASEVWRGNEQSNYYALTFDDGPYRLKAALWMDALEAGGAVGTFFHTGEWMDKHPDQAREIIERGHVLAPHTYHHRRMAQVGKEVFVSELQATELAYQEATGLPCPTFMRFPYCSYNDDGLRWLAEWGYTDLEGEDSGDWAGIPAAEIASRIVPVLQNGTIVVHHCNDIATGTPEALGTIIEHARSLGLVPVTVPDLLENLGIPFQYRRWKLVIEVPASWEHAVADWTEVEDGEALRELAKQVASWSPRSRIGGPESADEWHDELARHSNGTWSAAEGKPAWLGARSFEGTYWGFAQAYASGESLVIREHDAKERQADTLVYLLRWAAEVATGAGLKYIEATRDIRRMDEMCKQLGWPAKLVRE